MNPMMKIRRLCEYFRRRRRLFFCSRARAHEDVRFFILLEGKSEENASTSARERRDAPECAASE